MNQKEYTITSVLLSLGAHNIPTAASKHFREGDIITVSELKKFCRAYSLVYESNTANHSKHNRYIRALDLHMKVHLKATV